jgi:phosphatidylserine decarboxylase
VVREWRHDEAPVHLDKGAEMGRFLLGSTVVMLFTAQAMQELRANPAWAPGGAIRMGEAMAHRAA